MTRAIATAVLIFVLQLSLLLSANAQTQKPELVVQTGHFDAVNSVAFSPDGKIVASGSEDNTIKLWDVESGQELRSLTGHSDHVESVAFSPDGKTLASGSYDKTVKLWDVTSGQELRSLSGHSGSVESVAFSPDGKILASGGGNKPLPSPVGYDKTIKLWDVATGRELRTLTGHSSYVRSVAFNLDGKTLASGSFDGVTKLWDVASGEELRTFTDSSSSVTSVAFSPDGKTLASGSGYRTIKLWDVATGQEFHTLKADFYLGKVAFSPDGKTLASGSSDETIKLWDVVSGQELRSFTSHPIIVESIAFSPDGKTLVSSSTIDKTLKLWDVATGQELRSFTGHSSSVTSVAFSPDGKTLASGSFDMTTRLWDVTSGRELRTLMRTLTGYSSFGTSVTFSPDGKALASGNMSTIKLWDVASGQELHTLKGTSRTGTPVVFSPDGKTLASHKYDGTVELWDVASGQELRTLRGHSSVVTSIAFSPDGKTLASGSGRKALLLWDVASGQELRSLTGEISLGEVAFSPDGRTLASVSHDKTLQLWEVSSGRELPLPHKLPKWIRLSDDTALVNINGTMVQAIRDTDKIKLVNADTDQEIATLIAFDMNDWLVVTPDGLFDGTSAAWKRIIWRFNNNTFDYAPVEAYFNDFFYPNLLQDLMAGRRPAAPTGQGISQKDRRQIPISLKTAANTETSALVTSRTVALQVEVEEAPAGLSISDKSKQLPPSGAKDIRLFRNGTLVKLWRGDWGETDGCKLQPQATPQSPRHAVCTATVPIVAGQNQFTAYAFNYDNIKSSDATLTLTGADSLKRKGTAYVLAVGVNQYANPDYDLSYSVADAQAFGAEIQRQQLQLKRFDHTEVMTLLDQQATKANILQALKQLKEKAQPEDAVIIYFAGHGTAQQNRFYLIPHDLGYMGPRDNLTVAGLKMILSHGISDLKLEQAVEGIDAGQLSLVIDACNSGQALEAEEKRRGPMNSKGLAQLAYEKGMFILTAAQSYQLAKESSKLGHGLLTYVLIEEGLKTVRADAPPKDGSVTEREWLDYATQRVPQMQEEQQQKAVSQRAKRRRQPRQGVKADVQRPRVFYRRELEINPLIIARPQASSQGK